MTVGGWCWRCSAHLLWSFWTSIPRKWARGYGKDQSVVFDVKSCLPKEASDLRLYKKTGAVMRRFFVSYPPKSSSMMSSRSTPRSSSMLMTDWFMIGGPHM